MRAVIVGHWKRRTQAEALAHSLGARLLVDEGNHGALWAHKRALAWAADQDGPVLVLEDDAVPCDGMLDAAKGYSERHPGRLISLYLGQGRPPQWQARMRREIAHADRAGADHLELTQLCHAVAYIVPEGYALRILGHMRPHDKAADFAIGNSWRRITRQPVIYTHPSLVDHRDGPSVEAHPDGQDRVEKRRAWSFKDGVAVERQTPPQNHTGTSNPAHPRAQRKGKPIWQPHAQAPPPGSSSEPKPYAKHCAAD